mmetsp:Transcript_19477/g.35282  ORF Transcript_19477/g.35282 Transcript_19477/m.35282 type:complete len:83 (+) Transcript_19477:86-334(+)
MPLSAYPPRVLCARLPKNQCHCPGHDVQPTIVRITFRAKEEPLSTKHPSTPKCLVEVKPSGTKTDPLRYLPNVRIDTFSSSK